MVQQQSLRQQLAEEESQLKQNRDTATEKRKKLWREEAKLDSVLHNCSEEVRKAERTLASSVDKGTGSGLATIPQIVNMHQISGVYGPIYELFEVDERFQTAVEVAAGPSLFHVVVDTDETATKLLEIMNRDRSGRVTFIPLNRVKSNVPEYPQANDAVPLLSRLKFNDQFRKAFEQIFGSVIVCPNLEVAASYAKSHHLTVVTLDGGRVDRRGALFGGYVDTRHSRLAAAQNLKTWQTKLVSEQARAEKIKQEISELDQEVTKILGELQLVETKKKKLQIQQESPQHEAKLRKEEEALKDLIASKVTNSISLFCGGCMD